MIHAQRVGWTALLSLALVLPVQARPDATMLDTVVSSAQRSDKNRKRDVYRHPAQTLGFFGLKPEMTVVELWPGGGWYTEILAPLLAPKGQLVVTNFDPAGTGRMAESGKAALERYKARPEVFSKVQFALITPPAKLELGPDNSADLVLTFRNIHNWAMNGYEDKVYAAAYRVLKPNGIFGVEEHRADPKAKLDPKTGYMNEEAVIKAIEAAGFKLVAKSEINSNPKDTKDYPAGVWTLPPTLTEGDKDKDRYLTIGESDRMTLKFQKVVK